MLVVEQEGLSVPLAFKPRLDQALQFLERRERLAQPRELRSRSLLVDHAHDTESFELCDGLSSEMRSRIPLDCRFAKAGTRLLGPRLERGMLSGKRVGVDGQVDGAHASTLGLESARDCVKPVTRDRGR
jgi:hypothetical protein